MTRIDNLKLFSQFISELKDQKIKNMIIICGAGISTPSGIADFRSPKTGLYENLSQYNLPYPEALFELSYLRKQPRHFFTYIQDFFNQIENQKFKPNLVHYFLSLLHKNKLVRRIYTQNIDGLEKRAGLPNSHVVQVHGNIDNATCIDCQESYDRKYIESHLRGRGVPRCSSCRGIVKPDIVFYGEELDEKFWSHKKDFENVDAVLVLGTTMAVKPFCEILNSVRHNMYCVLMNNSKIDPFIELKCRKKFSILGDLVQSIMCIVEKVGWKDILMSIAQCPPPNSILATSKPKSVVHVDEEEECKLPKRRVRFSLPESPSPSNASSISRRSEGKVIQTPQNPIQYRKTAPKTASSSSSKCISHVKPANPTKKKTIRRKKVKSKSHSHRTDHLDKITASFAHMNIGKPKHQSTTAHRTRYGFDEAFKRVQATVRIRNAYDSLSVERIIMDDQLRRTLDQLDSIPLPAF